MDCISIKRFLSQTCCSCGIRESAKANEVQITKISKISATGSVHSLLQASANGEDDHTGRKKTPVNGTDNLGYQTEEIANKPEVDSPPQPIDTNVIKEQPKPKQLDVALQRQISDLSAISDFAPPSEKDFSEMVLEGLEKSFSNDETIKELEKSFHGREHDIKEQEEEVSTLEVDGTQTPTVEQVTDLAEEETEEQNEQPTKTAESGELEWRNKLIQDLDDDEEFILTSSEEEEGDGAEEEDKRSKSRESEHEINDNTKFTNGTRESNIKSSSQDVKCGGIPLVIDAGSYEIKAGLAGEYTPTCRFRTVVGKWRSQIGEAYREQYGDLLFGDEAFSKHNALALNYPVQGGVIDDWKDFQSVLDHTLSHFDDVDIKDHPLLITEPSVVSKRQRERQLEVIMEALHCPMTQIRSQATLSALTAGSDVALVVSSGHGYSEVVPVYYGYAIESGVQRVNVGGRHITEYLGRLLLKERGVNFSSVADLLVLDDMKRSYAEVKSEEVFPTEAWSKMIQHELPDGGIVELGGEIYKCTQPLFNPGLIGDTESLGLVDAIKQAVKSLEPDVRSEMKSSVLLSGGNCLLKGFRRQLKEKLTSGEKKKSKSGKKTWQVTSCHDLTNCAWIGGSLYADSEAFRDTCVTDDAYFEHGASIIHRYCF